MNLALEAPSPKQVQFYKAATKHVGFGGARGGGKGVLFTPGDHERIPGWMQCHYRLRFDDNGYPMMYVFSNCAGFRRTIPGLMYDEHRMEDLDTDGEAHIADEWDELWMSGPFKPVLAQRAEVKFTSDPLNQLEGMRGQGKTIATQIRLEEQ